MTASEKIKSDPKAAITILLITAESVDARKAIAAEALRIIDAIRVFGPGFFGLPINHSREYHRASTWLELLGLAIFERGVDQWSAKVTPISYDNGEAFDILSAELGAKLRE